MYFVHIIMRHFSGGHWGLGEIWRLSFYSNRQPADDETGTSTCETREFTAGIGQL